MYTASIIDRIDELIVTSSLTDKRFIPRMFWGLAQQVPLKSATGTPTFEPVKLQGINDAVRITHDDAYNIITYHRIISNTYGIQVAQNQVGDDYDEQTNTSDVIMIVIAFNEKVRLTMEQLEAVLVSNFPNTMERIFVNDLGMNSVNIQVTSSNLDSVAIFSQEWKGQGLDFIKPNTSLFQIRYRIDASYRKGCFIICEDCGEPYGYY